MIMIMVIKVVGDNNNNDSDDGNSCDRKKRVYFFLLLLFIHSFIHSLNSNRTFRALFLVELGLPCFVLTGSGLRCRQVISLKLSLTICGGSITNGSSSSVRALILRLGKGLFARGWCSSWSNWLLLRKGSTRCTVIIRKSLTMTSSFFMVEALAVAITTVTTMTVAMILGTNRNPAVLFFGRRRKESVAVLWWGLSATGSAVRVVSLTICSRKRVGNSRCKLGVDIFYFSKLLAWIYLDQLKDWLKKINNTYFDFCGEQRIVANSI